LEALVAEAFHSHHPAQARRKTVVLENSVELRRAPEEVFDYLSDIRNEREWSPTMQAVEMVSPGPLRVGSVYRARWKGGPTNTLKCIEFDRPHRWVHLSESSLWRVRFEGRVSETTDGSRLTARMEISANGFGKLFLPLFGRMMARQEQANTRHIKQALEPDAAA
jgi:hypothetical protein